MALDGYITIKETAEELGRTHNSAWRFFRSGLGDRMRLGKQRLFVRAHVITRVAAQRLSQSK